MPFQNNKNIKKSNFFGCTPKFTPNSSWALPSTTKFARHSPKFVQGPKKRIRREFIRQMMNLTRTGTDFELATN